MNNKEINEVKIRPGYQPIYQDFLQYENQLLFVTGLSHQKRIWVLVRLKQNPQECQHQLFGVAKSSKELFLLASFFLCQCFRAILERAKNYRLIQWCRTALFCQGERR
ncbi:MAG: hypothetical protein JSV38_02750 [Desulfobacterales bacterium]|nr:MAG: hypothetical protein JSV38_02750 [Desulfobacterales bacterium]